MDHTNYALDARRYFKQSEIVLYRQAPEITAAAAQSSANQITGAPPPERAGGAQGGNAAAQIPSGPSHDGPSEARPSYDRGGPSSERIEREEQRA